jgi:hypothetical protein
MFDFKNDFNKKNIKIIIIFKINISKT